MGLDMFLYGVKYFPATKNSDNKPQQKKQIIKTEEMYWRKANHIHNWFVNNVQEGIDDCEFHEFDVHKLLALKRVCQDAIDDPEHADEILPTQEGFFFGETDYDDYYFNSCQATIEAIDKIMEEDYDWYEYGSNW